jgi:hypothetical protein
MRSLSRIVKHEVAAGEPLPDAYQILAQNRIRLRRSSLQMVAGMPGAMKTMFALNMVDRMKVPTLFFSNDSNETTIASRMIARRVDRDSGTIADNLNQHREWASEVLADMDYVRWCFNASPSLPEIETELEAFNELYGDYPALTVVDVLMKVNYVEESEHSTLARIVSYLDRVARQTRTSVLLLHHTSETTPGNPCQPRSSVLQKVNQLPSLILTVATDGNQGFYVSPVKNRDGRQDATGMTYFRFKVNAARSLIEEDE